MRRRPLYIILLYLYAGAHSLARRSFPRTLMRSDRVTDDADRFGSKRARYAYNEANARTHIRETRHISTLYDTFIIILYILLLLYSTVYTIH